MRSFESLLNEFNSLPSGNIYEKKIKGKIYFYYQYSENGKKITRYVSNDELDTLREKINSRKELDIEIKRQLKATHHAFSLSKSTREYTGYVMSKDKVVAEFDKGQLIYINEELAPLSIKRTKSLAPFLKSRVIDVSRTNARLLKKAMNIKENDDELLSLCSYAASISDDYWFRPKKSKLHYKDITFTSDIFFDVSLKGILSFYPRKVSPTPELTTGGSFEKGWRNINGEWWLYKVGTKNELFSEMFYATLMKLINVPTAHYELDEGFIRTKNFASDYNYEPLAGLMGDNDDYLDVFNYLNNLNPNIAKQYLVLIYYDALLNNIDRHNENCGFLRDKKTGKIISLAPNFDDNLCLISRSEKLDYSKKEGFLSYFISFIRKCDLARSYLKEANLAVINEKILDKCLAKIEIKVDEGNIKKFVLNRYNYLKDEIEK